VSVFLKSRCAFDIPKKEQEIATLEELASAPNFWDDAPRAQAIMRRLANLQEDVQGWRTLASQIQDLSELAALAEGDEDPLLREDVERELHTLATEVDRREFQLLMSGPHDREDAILAIHAGTGGVDAQDWAQMLQRMYVRWAERRRYTVDVLDLSLGEEAGIKSVTMEIRGPYAYGHLKAERGVHRLVRLSPFDAAHRRHTSFALVEVMPAVSNDVDVVINPEDLRIDVFRSSGAGGQNVQKTSTAVRITHIPTGIVVTCQNERSQVQNKETAMKILRARLLERELEKKEQEMAMLKGEHVAADFGSQIRSYVLHPYTMVKDLRTDVETGNAAAVLDGEIDMFIDAWLKANASPA